MVRKIGHELMDKERFENILRLLTKLSSVEEIIKDRNYAVESALYFFDKYPHIVPEKDYSHFLEKISYPYDKKILSINLEISSLFDIVDSDQKD